MGINNYLNHHFYLVVYEKILYVIKINTNFSYTITKFSINHKIKRGFYEKRNEGMHFRK